MLNYRANISRTDVNVRFWHATDRLRDHWVCFERSADFGVSKITLS